MKSILSILFLAIFLPGLFNQGIIILNYELNKEVITELFCINKDKPVLSCAGQCHLKKQLEKEQEKDEEKEKMQQENIQFFSVSISLVNQQPIQVFKTRDLTHRPYIFIPKEAHLKGFFHPPQA